MAMVGTSYYYVVYLESWAAGQTEKCICRWARDPWQLESWGLHLAEGSKQSIALGRIFRTRACWSALCKTLFRARRASRLSFRASSSAVYV